MGWLKKHKAEEYRGIELNPALLAALNNQGTITRAEALNIPTVQGCVEFIANTVAMLPIKLYQDNAGEVAEIADDRRVFLLNDETGDLLDGFQLKKAWVRDYLLDGAGYIYINRLLNRVESLHYVKHAAVSVTLNADPIFKRCRFWVNGQEYRDFEFLKLTRNSEDGVTGHGIVEEHEKILSVAYQALIYENKLVKTGGCRKGFLCAEQKVEKSVLDDLKLAWKRLFNNSEENVIVLNKGLSFQEAANTSVEMQMNENKQTNAVELCKLFNIPPILLGNGATDSEITAGMKMAVMPVLQAIETALNKDLLLESEKGVLYFAFDTKELLKGDIEKRFRAYQLAVDSNIMQIDEVRYQEDLKPLGLNFIKLGLQDVLYDPTTKQIYTPNTNQTTSLTKGGGEKDENRNSG